MAKKQKYKKIVAFLILGSGFVTAYLILSTDLHKGKNKDAFDFAVNQKSDSFLNFKINPSNSINSQISQNLISNKTTNLTDAVAQNYLSEILKRNPEGPKTINEKQTLTVPSQTLMENALEGNLIQSLQFTQFKEKDIKISNNNSTKNQLVYLQSLEKINQKNFNSFNESMEDILDELMLNQNSEPLQKYTDIINKEIIDTLALETPSLWKEFHLQNLNLWQKKLIIFNALLELSDDPLKAYLSLQEIPGVIDENFDLQKVLETRFKELALKND